MQYTQLPVTDQLCAIIKDWHQFLNNNCSSQTVESYGFDICAFINFMHNYHASIINLEYIKDLDLMQLRGFFANQLNKGQAARSNARCLAAIRNFYRYLRSCHKIINNCAQQMQTPKIKKSIPKALNMDQVELLFDAFRNCWQQQDWIKIRDYTLFLLLYGCGLRISEALALNVDDVINNQDLLLTVTGKGNKKRKVPVLPIVQDTLLNYIDIRKTVKHKDSQALFIGRNGNRLHRGVAAKTIITIRQQYGLPDTTSLHALRHTFATHVLSNGGDVRTIQEIMGHSSLNTTQLYTKVEQKELASKMNSMHPLLRMNNNNNE